MRKKIRKVDVVSTKLTFINNNQTTFEDILVSLDGKEFEDSNKKLEFDIVENDPTSDYMIGIVITTQLKEIPPLRDRITKQYKSVGINITKESLAFANIFLFDKKRKLLIYEINKNGCYLNQFRDFVYSSWNSNTDNDDTRFDLNFPTIFRKNEYRRILALDYYKRFTLELLNPAELIKEFNEENSSMLKSIKALAESAAEGNADTIIYEQEVLAKSINKLGLSKSTVKSFIRGVRDVVNKGYRQNIGEFKIEGFDMDSGSPNKLRVIDLFGDAFSESFKIDNITIHIDTQQTERKLGIEGVYNRILPEIKNIIGI